jgi:hypothetical protein
MFVVVCGDNNNSSIVTCSNLVEHKNFESLPSLSLPVLPYLKVSGIQSDMSTIGSKARSKLLKLAW